MFLIGVASPATPSTNLYELLGHLSLEHQDFSIVITGNLPEGYKSALHRIVNRLSGWELIRLEDKCPIRPGRVYYTGEPQGVTIEEGEFRVKEMEEDVSWVDISTEFFQSLVELDDGHTIGISYYQDEEINKSLFEPILREDAFAVVVEESRKQEGKKDGIYYFPPGEVSLHVMDFLENCRILKEQEAHNDALVGIFSVLESKTGTDFSQYKEATINRRVTKRLEALGLKSVDAYYSYIKRNPQEIDELFQTVLIGVTEFFRDEKAYKALEDCLKNVLANKNKTDRIRIWCVGCASGEEPYTIAIMLAELLQENLASYNIQIFATDINEKALHKARKGIYTKAELAGMPVRLRDKYFLETEVGFEVKKIVRHFILFSRHDINASPPFVRLDLITCRNVLIYLKSELQREAIKTFHYSLLERGYLFLGKSESVSGMNDLFNEVARKEKIFQRAFGQVQYSLRFSSMKRYRPETVAPEPFKSISNNNLLEYAKNTLYQTYEHPFVIINEGFQVREIHGDPRLYLGVAEGALNSNLFKMVNAELALDLRALLAKVAKTGMAAVGHPIKFSLFDQEHSVRMRVLPLFMKDSSQAFYLVVFESLTEFIRYSLPEAEVDSSEAAYFRILELEEEIESAREHLQTFTEELETSNEELQSLNEELQSANEELKSANEELETSNEELQSANEELQASNSELRISNNSLVKKEEELRESQETLARKQQKYITLAENIPNGTIGIVDREMVWEFVAGTGLEKFNVKAEDVIGKKALSLNSPAEGQKVHQILQRTFDTQEPQHGEFKYRDFDLKIHTIPLKQNGQTERVMYLTQDVTEERRLLYELKESEARFRSMADSAPVAIWMMDADLNLTYVNQEWTRYTGREQEESLNQGWLEAIYPKDRERIKSELIAATSIGSEWESEYRLCRPDNSFHYVFSRGCPRYDHRGNFLGLIGSTTDIHDQKVLEHKKDEFMSIASHELKTPLTAVKAYLQLLTEDGEAYPSDQVTMFVSKALNATNRLHSLIEDFLDVSRIESGRFDYQTQAFQFDVLVQDAVETFNLTHSYHQVNLEGKTNALVEGNYKKIEQVFFNLLSNAEKYSPDNGEIQVLLSQDDGFAQCSVLDKGVGIPKSLQKKVFSRFFRVDHKSFASGLGLYICYEIVARHEGEIWIESEVGHGTAVHFRLPIQERILAKGGKSESGKADSVV